VSVPPALRFGVLSTARIARSFCRGLASSRHVRVDAVASRDAGRAREFAADLGIPRHLDSYEALLADPDIDAVYIAVPNSLHAHWSIRALESGKHVLCEKPLAVDAREAQQMFAVAHAQGRHLAEGYPYRTQPQTLKLRELLQAGAIGRPRFVQAHFTFTLQREDDIRLQPLLAGGALMDVGCYCVSLIRMIAAQRPARVFAGALWTGDAGGVDRAIAATLEFPDGLIAQLTSGLAAALERHALIVGTDGVLQTSFFNHPPASGRCELLFKSGRDSREDYQSIPVPAMNGFLAEAEAFERLVRLGAAHWTGATSEESIDIAQTLEAVLHSARSGKPVDLPD